MKVDASHESDPHETLYCAGCNARFHHTRGSGVCPRCGVEVRELSADWLEETLLIREDVDGDTGGCPDAAHTPDELDRLIGSELGIYQCESLLGAGGMGRVYLAHHRDLGRKCAVKILAPRLAAKHADYVARFQQEARSAAALVHPNIVTAHAMGDTNGLHFLEMEFVAGRSLQRLIEDEGRLTPIRATALTLQIAEGLSAAHRERIVHRDLKPDNVLLTRQGIPKIADFGLAKHILPAGDGPDRWLAGTPNFMAPELFQGAPAAPTSDVYALGVCYFLLLTGRLPFTGGTLEELKRKAIDEPFPPVRRLCPDIALEMAEGVSLLLAKAPENRPQDGIEAAQLLQAVLGQVRDVESLLQAAFPGGEHVSWTRSGSRYELMLSLPDGRRQRIFIEPSDHGPSERLLLIFSVCCAAQPHYYEDALRLNAEIPLGGLAIRDIDGESKFVMIDTYPRGTVDAEEVRRSALEVAFRADAVEKLLTGDDCH